MIRNEIMDEVLVFWLTKFVIFIKKNKFRWYYYYGGNIYESFICFAEAPRLDPDGLTAQIIDIFDRYKL